MTNEIYTVQEIQEILRPVFESWALSKAWLFGSYAQGKANINSDIDLRIEGGKMKGIFGFGAFRNDMENALKKSVDIVTNDGLANSLHKDTSERFMENMRREELLIYDRQG